MKVITLWQPYATLFIMRFKANETRGWATQHRGKTGIHAAKRPVAQTLAELPDDVVDAMRRTLAPLVLEDLPTGALLGEGNLVACREMDHEYIKRQPSNERMFGYYAPGRVSWEFDDVKQWGEPVPAKGKQGLWNWDENQTSHFAHIDFDPANYLPHDHPDADPYNTLCEWCGMPLCGCCCFDDELGKHDGMEGSHE